MRSLLWYLVQVNMYMGKLFTDVTLSLHESNKREEGPCPMLSLGGMLISLTWALSS